MELKARVYFVWKVKLFKSIIIHEIAQSIIVLWYNTHDISNSPLTSFKLSAVHFAYNAYDKQLDLPDLEENEWKVGTEGIEYEWTSGAIVPLFVIFAFTYCAQVMELMKMGMKWKWTVWSMGYLMIMITISWCSNLCKFVYLHTFINFNAKCITTQNYA